MNRKVKVFARTLVAFVWLFLAESCVKETVVEELEDNEGVIVPTVSEEAAMIQVGTNKPFKTIKEAAEAAGNNTIIAIDAGTYKGDVAEWTQDSLVIRAVGGEVILDADGKYVDGMGIWKINGGTVYVEGITFRNAKVPDGNGAGIRLVNGQLTVVGCRFLHNQMGILTSNFSSVSLTVRNSEFGYGGNGDGLSHNIYVGQNSRVDISGCWFHHGNIGHLIKSRAAISFIYCNLIADGNDANSLASYEIDIPSGGQAVIVGNIIQQSATTDNPHFISFAKEERNRYEQNRIFIAHNTFLNSHNGSDDYVLGAPTSGVEIYMLNNVIQDNAKFNASIPMDVEKGTVFYKPNELTADYLPASMVVENWKSKLEKDIDTYLPPELKDSALWLTPTHQYLAPMSTKKLTATPSLPGAVQLP
ncbi:MAG: hypothetical protein LBB84_10480 [Tannerellaceae bacterium]|jgi:hypothetical protein|nr:hypothetical protein [Tannerellaceae bacterium]